MRALLILPFVIFWPLLLLCQNITLYKVSGRIVEENKRYGLSGASVTLVNSKDSTATRFSTITDENGLFLIPSVNPGNYKVFVSHIGYQSKLLSFVISTVASDSDLGEIILVKKLVQLKEIEITGAQPPILIKNDTVEFRADYYKTKGTSPLENLFKKLPGLEISPDGIIKYKDRVIETILIDGRPYFGNDIKKATKNILSGIIETVQIIDRESNNPDHSLSNIDEKEKIINLTLKRDAYNQLNGSIEASVGDMSKYRLNSSINRFGHSNQISLILGANNISNSETDGGVPENQFSLWNVGLNYNIDINPKMTIGASYSFDAIDQAITSVTSRKTILKDSVIDYQQSELSKIRANVHYGTLNFNYKIDSLTTISITGNFSANLLKSTSNTTYSTISIEQLINSGNLSMSNIGNKVFINGNITLNHKFIKKGRKFKLSVNQQKLKDDHSYLTGNMTHYYSSGEIITTDSLKQYFNSIEKRLETDLGIEYSEPLGKDVTLLLFYNYNIMDNSFEKNTFDFNPFNDKIDIYNDSLSGIVPDIKETHNGRAIVKIQNSKVNVELGASLINISQRTSSNLVDEKYSLSTFKFFPSSAVDVKINSKSKVHFDYSMKLIAPQRQQLFVIPNIYNPLNLVNGNSGLKPSKIDYLNISYYYMDPHTARTLSIIGRATFTQNQIVRSTNYDTLGRLQTVSVNLNGYSYGSLYVVNGFRLKAFNSTMSTSNSISWSREIGLINKIKTTADKYSFTQGVNLNYRLKDNLDVSTSIGYVFNQIRYPSNYTLNTNYSDYLFTLNTNLDLPGNISFAPYVNYRLSASKLSQFNNSRLILNFNISKYFLKSQALMFRVQGFDIFNQNGSIVRNVSAGLFESVESNALQRFFMVGVVFYVK